ncbi:MAG: dihydrolipoamide acetyltransferase family protein, partial [Bacillota bacterium]
MSVEVCMPKFGMTMQEGTIVTWLKAKGEAVHKGEPVAEVESEKITNTVDAPESGVIRELLFSEGDTVSISEVIAYIDEDAAVNGSVRIEKPCETAVPVRREDGKEVLDSIPYSGLRKTIGDRMAASLLKSPQGTMTVKADMTGVISLKNRFLNEGYKVSFTDILVKIIGLALTSNQMLNASIEDGRIVMYKSVNIGVAVGLDNGLFVPVIRDADKKTILEISTELKEMVQKIKDNTVSPADISGGTFTVSNMGMFDVDIITPIINPPESAI